MFVGNQCLPDFKLGPTQILLLRESALELEDLHTGYAVRVARLKLPLGVHVGHHFEEVLVAWPRHRELEVALQTSPPAASSTATRRVVRVSESDSGLAVAPVRHTSVPCALLSTAHSARSFDALDVARRLTFVAQ